MMSAKCLYMSVAYNILNFISKVVCQGAAPLKISDNKIVVC